MFVDDGGCIDRRFEVATVVADPGADTELGDFIIAAHDVHADVRVDFESIPEGFIHLGDRENPVRRQRNCRLVADNRDALFIDDHPAEKALAVE